MTEHAHATDPASGTSAKKVLSGLLGWVVLGLVLVAVLIAGYFILRHISTEDVRVEGLRTPLQPSAAAAGTIRVHGEDTEGIRVFVDDRETSAVALGNSLAVRAPGLRDGDHDLRVVTPRALSWFGSSATHSKFTVDSSPPQLSVEDSLRPKRIGDPVTVNGTAKNASQVHIAGKTVTPNNKGEFSVVVDRPERDVVVAASDPAGNRTEKTMTVHVKHPGMRAVHMTGLAWTSPSLREPVLEMARQGKIDTIELDIKDESGEVPYDTRVPMAQRIGAAKGYYDARKTIDQLHKMGVRVVGRLVAFKDPLLGEASWRNGHPERVAQNAQGQPWSSGYGNYAFTNFADPTVRQYNIDIAAEAAALGFDDILYDYVRRPDGAIEKMRFPGLTETPEQSIAGFLRQTQSAVRSDGALLGASVFGISVNRPTQIAQDIPRMARYVDYIAPMVYPSHWGPGEFGVADPNTRPYDIVHRSLGEFAKAVRGTDVQIIPWLQDFSLGAPYGPAEVAAQIKAARDNQMPSFLLWAPNCRYHDQALTPPPRR